MKLTISKRKGAVSSPIQLTGRMKLKDTPLIISEFYLIRTILLKEIGGGKYSAITGMRRKIKWNLLQQLKNQLNKAMDHFEDTPESLLKEYEETSSFDLLFGERPGMAFYEPESLDIINYLSIRKFLAYLITNREATKADPYHRAVSSMCEYWVWWAYHKLKNKKHSGWIDYISGYFGFWEHHWIRYKYNGESYFVDMTLAQFNPIYPKIAVTKEIEARLVKNKGLSLLSLNKQLL